MQCSDDSNEVFSQHNGSILRKKMKHFVFKINRTEHANSLKYWGFVYMYFA